MSVTVPVNLRLLQAVTVRLEDMPPIMLAGPSIGALDHVFLVVGAGAKFPRNHHIGFLAKIRFD